MDQNAQQALPQAIKLIDLDEDELFAELGLRKQAIAANAQGSDQFAMTVAAEAFGFPSSEVLGKIGRRYFDRVNRSAHELVCGTDPEFEPERKQLYEVLTSSKQVIAATLAGLLVSGLGIAPALAAVLGVIVVKLFFDPAHETLCQTWSESLSGQPR